ncbi:MAG TPA: BF3164 family lipoprotein [Longimicrobium sp.]|jgi:hypothetical protein
MRTRAGGGFSAGPDLPRPRTSSPPPSPFLRSARRLCALAACAAAAACHGERRDPGTLRATVVYQGPGVGRPAALALTPRWLVLADDYADSVVQIVDRRTGERVRALGRKGSGPGEFRAPWAFAQVDGRPDEVWLYDLQLARLTRIPLPPQADPGPARATISLPNLPLTGPFWVGDSLLLSPGIFGAGARFARVAASGRLLGYVGPPPPGAAATPMVVRQHAYQSSTAYSAARGLVVLADRHADRLELYRSDGTPVRTIAGRNGFGPVYTVAPRGHGWAMATDETLRFGYVDVAATGDAIYALYSGRRRRDFPGRASLASTLHVYDWGGRLRRVHRLDADVVHIAVDSAARQLYALRLEPAPAILRYDLPR